jgi:predicted HNH restriction endonuclease
MSGKKWKRYRPEHSRMFNDPRWADLKRLVWHRDGGRCQMCKREGIEAGIQDGYIRSGFACHHIVPFESAKTTAEMERLFFDANNIMLVCRECHAKIHRELGSHKKEVVQARRAERFSRWVDKMKGDITDNGDR